MATEFLNYKIDKALLEQNYEHNRKSCSACVDRKSAGCAGGRIGLRHVQILYAALASALLVACNQAPATMLPQIIGLVPGSPDAPVYDWRAWQCGLFLSSASFGHALFAVVGLRGGRRLLMAALLVAGSFLVALPAIIQTGGWIWACAARAVTGAAGAALVPVAHELLARWLPPHERKFVAPLVYYSGPVGAIATMSGCAVLGMSVPGWPLSLYLTGAFALAGFTLLLCLTSDAPHSFQAMSEEERDYIVSHNCMKTEIKFTIPWRQLLSSHAAWAAWCNQLCCELPHWLLLYLMPIYFTRVLHYSYTQSASLCAVSYATGWAVAGLRPRQQLHIFGLELTPSVKFLQILGAVGTAASLGGAALGGTHAASAALLAPVFTALQAISLVDAQVSISPRFAACCKTMRSTAGYAAGLLPLAACWLLRTDDNIVDADVTAWRVVLLSCAGAALIGAIFFLVFGFRETSLWNEALRHYNDKAVFELENLKTEKENTCV